MEGKKYPKTEEDGYGALSATEPAVAYASEGCQHLQELEMIEYPDDYDPGIGPYSIEELNSRIERTEKDINDPSKWVHVDDFWAAMKREHPWLR